MSHNFYASKMTHPVDESFLITWISTNPAEEIACEY